MSGPELGLAIFATVDICLRHVKFIVEKYHTLKNARTEIEERTLLFEATWLKTSQQLAFLRRVWGSLSVGHQEIQERIIRVLERKLDAVVQQISKLEKHSNQDSSATLRARQAGKYALWGLKESFENALRDLQAWQSEFDLSWLWVLHIADRVIDIELARPGADQLSAAKKVRHVLQMGPAQATGVFLEGNKLQSARRSDIPDSTFQLVELADSKRFILDSADIPVGKDPSIFRKDIRYLAAKLQQSAADSFPLLKCHGVVPRKDSRTTETLSYDFIFKLPKGGSEPRSLRSHLLSQKIYSLGERIHLAKQLAMSTNYIHVLDIVHKNIRPESVLIFKDNEQRSKLGRSFLLGFKEFRMADGRTNLAGNSAWDEELYRHPDRQGIEPRREYIMQHDIYSLGVCFLEIGLWESFVTPGKPNNSLAENGSLKDGFVKLAKEKLPSKMGEKYMNVVVNCLSCLDATNKDFCNSAEFEDNDGIMLGSKYIEKILLMLSEISV